MMPPVKFVALRRMRESNVKALVEAIKQTGREVNELETILILKNLKLFTVRISVAVIFSAHNYLHRIHSLYLFFIYLEFYRTM